MAWGFVCLFVGCLLWVVQEISRESRHRRLDLAQKTGMVSCAFILVLSLILTGRQVQLHLAPAGHPGDRRSRSISQYPAARQRWRWTPTTFLCMGTSDDTTPFLKTLARDVAAVCK